MMPASFLSLRRMLEIAVGCACIVVVMRCFVVMGLVVPVRVSAGSMAPHLIGPHWELRCDRCGKSYHVGTDAPPQAGRTVCWACGETVLIGRQPTQPGEAILVDRLSLAWNEPRRWQPVVFRCPTNASQFCVKRIIGLPGERVSLEHGDVHINGRLVRKTFAEQQTMRVLVHRESRHEALWTPMGSHSSWERKSVGSFEWALTGTRRDTDEGAIDWLEYRIPDGAATDDGLAYNAGISAIRNDVIDLMLTLRARFDATSSNTRIWIRCPSLKTPIVQIDVAAQRVDAETANVATRQTITDGRRSAAAIDGTVVDVCLSLFDRQLLVAQDGQILLKRPIDDVAPSDRPFAIGVAGTGVRIGNLALWRDIVYTPAPGDRVALRAQDARWQLGRDEYFVLGDNPAISDDSRSWRPGPGLQAKLLVGTAVRLLGD